MKILLPILLVFLVSCPKPPDPEDEQDSVGLFVIEKDRLLGGFNGIDNYHNTFIINTTHDSIIIDIESPTPDTLKRESTLSPAFGRNAFFDFDYSKRFDIPNTEIIYLADKPDTSTTGSHFWNDFRLGPSDGIHVPYSSYRGEGEQLYIQELGVNKFFDLEVISDYSIKKNLIDSTQLDIQIIQTMQNTGPDTLFWVGVVLYIPKGLNTKPSDTNLYNLISDTVICDIRCDYARDFGRVDGFAVRGTGQQITTRKDTLLPYQSYNFTYQMIIEPLLDKFEIYPMYIIYIETRGERIWPGSIITINNNRYSGPVQYLKVCGLAIPTYILFSINGDDLQVLSPDDIEPTFKP